MHACMLAGPGRARPAMCMTRECLCDATCTWLRQQLCADFLPQKGLPVSARHPTPSHPPYHQVVGAESSA